MRRGIVRTLAGSIALAMVVAACSSAGSTSITASSSGGSTAAGVTEIPMWIAFSDQARLGFTQKKAEEFNAKHPDYKVVVQGFDSYNTVFEKSVLAVNQGKPPAIIHFFEAATQQALDAVDAKGNPIFKSVTDAIAGRTSILGEPVVLNDVVNAAKNYYTVNGSFYSFPWNTSSAIMFSNTDMLKKAGVDTIPKTWAEVDAACAKVMALSPAPKACITWPNHSWFVEQTLGQEGELLANNENGRKARATEVYLESKGLLAYLDWWKSLNTKGYYLNTGQQRDWNGTSNAFQAQQVAMLVYSSSDTTALTDAGTANGFKVEASFMPYNQDVPYQGNLIGGATLWMLNGLDKKTEDGALAFMNFFNNPQNAAEWHKITGYIPITNAAVALLDKEGWYQKNPNSKVASDQLAAAKDTPATRGALLGNFVGIRDVITGAIEDILANNKDVATRMKQANTDANKLLTEYNALNGK